MDDSISNPCGVSLPTTQAIPSPPEVCPKVPLSTSSSGFSLPIRAPVTIDSDFEYSALTNGLKNSTSSSYSSDSGFDSEGFVSGEDEFQFETASERPSFADPDDETLEESRFLGEFNVSRPFVINPDEEIDHVQEYGVSGPFVVDTDEETPGVLMDEEDEYDLNVEPAVTDRILSPSKQVMPIAQLSLDSDDDSVDSEDVEDDAFSGPVRVPGAGVIEKLNSAPKVKVSDGGGEEDELQFESLIEAETVEDSISGEVVNGVLGSFEEEGPDELDSISAELVEDKGPDDMEEAKAESMVTSKENSELVEDVKYSVEEIQALGDMEQTSELDEGGAVERSNVDLSNNAVLKLDSMTQRDVVVDKEVVEDGAVMAAGIDTVSLVVEYPVKSKPLEADKDADSSNEANFVVDGMGLEANVVGDVSDRSVSNMNGVEVLERSEDVDMVSDLTNYVNDATSESKFLETDAGFPSEIVELTQQEMEVEVTEVDKNVNFGAVLMNNQNCENNGVDVNESAILSQGSDNEKFDSEVEKTDWGVESHDSVTPSRTESIILEPVSLSSYSGPEFEVENKDKADHDPDNLTEEEEGSLSDDDAEGLIFGDSDTTKQIISELEQRFSPISLSGGGSSQDPSQIIDGEILPDSDEEVDTDEETEGKEVFDSAALAALLKAATGVGMDGGSVKFTSSDGSRVFSLERPSVLGGTFRSLRPNPEPNSPNLFPTSELIAGGESESEQMLSEEEKKKFEEIQQIRVKFLRLVQRLGLSAEDSIAAQVLYRLVLATGGHSGKKTDLESAKMMAMEVEADGKNDLNFSLNILVIGKTGVGKSATINSIFGEERAMIDAFEPATTDVKEIVGTIDGVEVRVLDTPGLKSSLVEQSFNMKILSSIKRFTKKYPPDVVLYVDRVDTQTRDLNDLPLLRSITSSLGSSIWRNAIVTLTHAASTPPDGPSGSPLSYEVFVSQRSRIIKQLISHVIGDLHMMNPGLMNPVSLVENHPLCKKDGNGQIMLPNGESWRPQLLLLCYSMKILSEANSVMKTQDPLDRSKLFGFRIRSPTLPYFLSSLLQSYSHPKLSTDQGGDNVDSDFDLRCLSDSDLEDEEEYDELPPFKPLRKSQISKLSKEQRKAYFEEYDYRVKLLQKKQWREDVKRLREMKKKGKDSGKNYSYTENDGEETGSPSVVPVPLPDMVLPLSFDGENPAYRYRFLEPASQILMRPVLDPQGWDHDWGYDGVSIEQNVAIADQFPAVIAVQITKDKKEFNIHMESAVSAKHGENGSTMGGIDVQSIGKQVAYILKGETKMKNFKMNKTAAGVCITFLGENVVTGVKVEDEMAVGKRLVLVGSSGAIRSQGDNAYGANLEVRIRETDYPIGEDQTMMGLSLVRWRGDLIWGCNLNSQFSVGRSSKLAVRAGLNSRRSGQITVRTSSSGQLQIALVALLPIANAIFKNILPRFSEKYS